MTKQYGKTKIIFPKTQELMTAKSGRQRVVAIAQWFHLHLPSAVTGSNSNHNLKLCNIIHL